MPSTLTNRAGFRAVFGAVLAVVPLVIALGRGTADISEPAYAMFHIAESYSTGRGFPYVDVAGQPQVTSPLFVVWLAAMAWVGLPLPWIALLSGAAAWSLAALAVRDLGRRMGFPFGGALAALLIACSPASATPNVLATHVPWVVCLAWWAIWATRTDTPRIQTALLCSLLATEADAVTVGLAVFLLLWRWERSGRKPWWTALSLGVLLIAWGLVAHSGLVVAPEAGLDLASVGQRFRLLGRESEFYWFFAVWAGTGVVAATRLGLPIAGLVWLGALALSASETGWALFLALSACLAGLGIAVVGRWLVAERLVTLPPRQALLVVGLVGIAPLLVAQATSVIGSRAPYTPAAEALLTRAARYVAARSEPGDVVLAPTIVGYLAKRPTVAYSGLARDTVALARVLAAVEDSAPVWSVSTRSLGWDDLQRTGWFQSTYFEVEAFTSPYASISPVIAWRRRLARFDIGDYAPLNVRLPDGRFWVGHTYDPDRVAPGQSVSVTLYVHAPQPVARAHGATVYLRSPAEDGERLAQQLAPEAQAVLIDDPEIGEVRAERFELRLPEDLAVGAYYLSASLFERDSDRFAQIYQDDLVFPIDRVTLGYVVVPWTGDTSEAVRVGANLGDRATLVGYDLGGPATAGSPLNVMLYWEGRAGAADVTSQHFVFVHLLDGDGNLVAQHDGPPVAGRYPVQAWIPGEIVPDAHTLALGSELPAGEYGLRAGMYTWPTLERLPAWDAEGKPLADGVVLLGDVTVVGPQ